MTRRHQRAALLTACRGVYHPIPIEYDCGAVRWVNKLQPAAYARDNFACSRKEHMSVHLVVGIAFVCVQENPRSIGAVLMHPSARYMSHDFRSRSYAHSQLVWVKVSLKGFSFCLEQGLTHQSPPRITTADRSGISFCLRLRPSFSCGRGFFLKSVTICTSDKRHQVLRRASMGEKIGELSDNT